MFLCEGLEKLGPRNKQCAKTRQDSPSQRTAFFFKWEGAEFDGLLRYGFEYQVLGRCWR